MHIPFLHYTEQYVATSQMQPCCLLFVCCVTVVHLLLKLICSFYLACRETEDLLVLLALL